MINLVAQFCNLNYGKYEDHQLKYIISTYNRLRY